MESGSYASAMARIEVLLSDEIDDLLRRRAHAEQSTVSDCVRMLIEQVLTDLDGGSDDEDEEALRAGFAEFARNYPSLRRDLFDDDPDLRLDDPFEPEAKHGDPVAVGPRPEPSPDLRSAKA